MNEVLVVDDDAGVRAGLEVNFRRQGWQVRAAGGAAEALAKFRQNPCPLVVTDMRMPDGDGMGVVEEVRRLAPRTAVILLTAFGNVPDAVRAMRAGACDYLMKPAAFPRLLQTAERMLRAAAPGPEAALIGDSLAMRRLAARAAQVARTEADVLIEAESGAGKEVLARFLHAASQRHHGPMVAVNCAALPETLLESELFGHVRGAFSGAVAAKPGKFELADHGTLLLDEIGEMPLVLQPKLLRVLQQREIDRLGDTRPLPVDVRVVATTNRSLAARVAAGEFRADLYYRLNVVPLAIPPLRERREDIPELARHFLRLYDSDGHEFTPPLLAALAERTWPGNVRELENFVRRALALAAGPSIGPEALEEAPAMTPVATTPGAESEPVAGWTAGLSWREAERRLLVATLAATGGNRTRAADMLGLSLRTIRNKIRAYRLPPRGVACG